MGESLSAETAKCMPSGKLLVTPPSVTVGATWAEAGSEDTMMPAASATAATIGMAFIALRLRCAQSPLVSRGPSTGSGRTEQRGSARMEKGCLSRNGQGEANDVWDRAQTLASPPAGGCAQASLTWMGPSTGSGRTVSKVARILVAKVPFLI